MTRITVMWLARLIVVAGLRLLHDLKGQRSLPGRWLNRRLPTPTRTCQAFVGTGLFSDYPYLSVQRHE
jgi:hypothetical protein